MLRITKGRSRICKSIENWYRTNGGADGRFHTYSKDSDYPDLWAIKQKYGEKDNYFDKSHWITGFNGCTFTYNFEEKKNGKRQKESSGLKQIDLSKVGSVTAREAYDKEQEKEWLDGRRPYEKVTRYVSSIVLTDSNGNFLIDLPPGYGLTAINNAVRVCRKQVK